MSTEEIKALLSRVHDALQDTEVDASTRELLADLDQDIHAILRGPGEPAQAGVLEKAERLETEFAAQHPLAERFLRELMDALARMGI